MRQKTGSWIWKEKWEKEDREQPGAVYFRKTFALAGKPLSASLKITADTRYKLYVNGDLVQLGPSRGNPQIWYVDTVDLAGNLREGKNVLAVSVLRYPEDTQKGNHGMFRTKTPGLFITGSVETMDKTQICLSTDSSWKCRKDPRLSFVREEERFSPLYIHERAAGTPELISWKEADYDDSGWEAAREYPADEVEEVLLPKNLAARTIPFVYRKRRVFAGIMEDENSVVGRDAWENLIFQYNIEEKNAKNNTEPNTEQNTEPHTEPNIKQNILRNVRTVVIQSKTGDEVGNAKQGLRIPSNTTEEIVLDAGEEMTGYLYTKFAGGRGAQVEYLYAECYVQEETGGPTNLKLKKDRLDKVHGHLEGYTDRYTASGCGTEELPETYAPYWFRTFRFVRLRIRTEDEPLVIKSLYYEETGYPLEVKTSVETSDPSLLAIWDLSLRTLRRCMHETYMDCPYYEQLQYAMDARQEILYTYAVSADDRLARKCMDDLRRSQRPDGLLNCCYPNCNTNVIPGFPIYYILMVYDHMMYFGDRALVEEHLPAIEKILGFFHRHLDAKGYVGKIGGVIMTGEYWSFLDWAPEWDATSGMPPAGVNGPLTAESLLYIWGLQHAARLFDYVGNTQKAAAYKAEASRVQQALRVNCMEEDGLLMDGPRVREYSQFTQVLGILTDTVDLNRGKRIIERTLTEKDRFPQCTIATALYLFQALAKTGLYSQTEHCWDKWREMLALHCTTSIESEAARSECHAWGSVALYELPAVILGVQPAAPGFRKIRVSPAPGYLTFASGKVCTPAGDVLVSWKMENGECKVTCAAPEGVEVELENL